MMLRNGVGWFVQPMKGGPHYSSVIWVTGTSCSHSSSGRIRLKLKNKNRFYGTPKVLTAKSEGLIERARRRSRPCFCRWHEKVVRSAMLLPTQSLRTICGSKRDVLRIEPVVKCEAKPPKSFAAFGL